MDSNEKKEAIKKLSVAARSKKNTTFTDCALMYYDSKHLSRLNLHTSNSSASKDILPNYERFVPSRTGWRSKNIVDAYILGLIEVSNLKSESEDFVW